LKQSKIKLGFELILWVVLCIVLAKLFGNKNYLVSGINQYLPKSQASMLVAMLWGDVSGVSKDFYNQMVETGLIHILVVSGSNLMIVVKGLVEVLAQWVSRKRAIIFGIMIGFLYVNLVGFSMPATRAIVMVTVMYFAQLLGRKINLIRMIILVILIMVLADYRVLGSVSFWMSFLAFVAICQNQNEGVIKTTMRVNLYLLPILAWKFGSISLIAPISNLLTLFLVETVTVLGFIGIIVKPLLWLLFPLLVYIQQVVNILARLHWAQIEISFNCWMMVGMYMIGIGYYMRKNSV